jgi:hypothetical protein
MQIGQNRPPDALYTVSIREREVERLAEFLTNWDTWVRTAQVPDNVAADVKELLTGITVPPDPAPNPLNTGRMANRNGLGFE